MKNMNSDYGLLKASDCWDSTAHKQIIEYSSRLLWRFIQPNARESEAEEVLLNLTGLTRHDLKVLADIRFLLSSEVKILLNDIAPKIITKLSKESVNECITDRGRVRGRIDWQRTIGVRAAAGNDTSLYVYLRRSQVFDLPENRVFLYIIRHIFEKARNFSENYLELTWYAEAEENSKWVDRISVIAFKCTQLLRNPFISKIGNLYELTDRIIEKTKKCRSSHYKQLADIAECCKFCQDNPLSFLKKELDGNIFEPLNRDTLYEIAILFKTLNTVMENGWEETRAGLIGSSAKTVSKFAINECELIIYYQKLPREMALCSNYGDLMTEYGLSEKLRRPDIILLFTNGQWKKYFIVEVKRSRNRGYLVDGTYKLLGYLKDFEKIKNNNVDIGGLLVGWSGIKQQDYIFNKEAHLFNWDNYEDGLKELLMEIKEMELM